MDPFHPWNDPASYGRDYERPLERPEPGINPDDFFNQRDYQDRLFIERMRRDHEAQHHGDQYVDSWLEDDDSHYETQASDETPLDLLRGHGEIVADSNSLADSARRALLLQGAPQELL